MGFRWKKNKNCTEEERATGEVGDIWDHAAIDPRTKVLVSLVQSPSRDQLASDRLVEDFARRTSFRPPKLITTDEHATYRNSILKTYGETYQPRRRTKIGPKKKPRLRSPKGMVYATVKKTRKAGRVVEVKTQLVMGTKKDLATTLASSPCSTEINTSFIERNNGTTRHFNPRKQRKSYAFSKQLEEHVAMSWLAMVTYNFAWTPRTLRVPLDDETYRYLSPAMAAGITDHVWSIAELLAHRVF